MQDVKHPLPGVIPSSLLLQPEFVSTNSTICIFLHRFLRCLFLKFLETTFAWIWLPALTSLKHMEVSNPWGYPILSSISRQDVPLKTIHFWSTLWFFNIAILWAIYTMAMLVITRGYPIYGNPQKNSSMPWTIAPVACCIDEEGPAGGHLSSQASTIFFMNIIIGLY